VNASLVLLAFLAALPNQAPGFPPPPPADVARPPAGARPTASGLVMKVLRRGRGREHPRDNDCVKVHYSAWKRDGSFLTTSRRGGGPEDQCLRTAFPGIAEALRGMVVGEERRLWVPGKLTYVGDDDDRPPQLDATFDVELVEIKRAPATPLRLVSPPRQARTSPDGLAVEVLKRGTGIAHPDDHSQVKVHFSGWTTDGRLVESSVMADHPGVFAMTGVIRGWREALTQMVVGQKVRVWIPTALAYGAKPRRGQPRGPLVYELELLQIE
jgi:FKBP-type peptidyl-prolyl cis-trans isomerase